MVTLVESTSCGHDCYSIVDWKEEETEQGCAGIFFTPTSFLLSVIFPKEYSRLEEMKWERDRKFFSHRAMQQIPKGRRVENFESSVEIFSVLSFTSSYLKKSWNEVRLLVWTSGFFSMKILWVSFFALFSSHISNVLFNSESSNRNLFPNEQSEITDF